MNDELARQLLSASPDALWLIGLDGSTLYGNDRLAELLGRAVEELTAESVFDVTDEQGRIDLARHFADMNAHHPGGQNDEVYTVRPDGSRVWSLVSWTPTYDDDGTLIGYLHRLTEYTERRELRDRLSQREAELQSAQTIARLGNWTWDVVNDVVTWSPELFRIYGVAEDEFEATYEWFMSHTHPDERSTVAAVIKTCLREGRDYEYEGRAITAHGEERWIRARGVADLDEQGNLKRLHGTCQDISDLHSVALDATEARRRLRLLSSIAEAANRSDTLEAALGRAGHALHSIDEWHTRTVWSRSDHEELPVLLHDLTGESRDVPEPSLIADLSAWATGEVTTEPVSRTGGTRVWLPVRLGRRTVRLIELEGAVARVDEPTRSLLVQVAMTLGRVAEREQAAVELASARDDAITASAHKSAFLATMSHEIRTPMNGVIGLNDLLLRTDLDAHQRRLAEGLRGAGQTLLALLNDILDLSKIESGAVELEHAPFQVAHLLDQIATISSPPAQEKRLEFVLTCDPAVPHTVVGDRVRLGQVLTNLVSNAVKFTDQGEVVVELSLDERSQPGHLLLRGEVRDTGMGIGADAAELFEAFTQADRSTTRSHGGTGLGLTISRRLVHDMGGSIGADERPGGGSIFWFVVPLESAPPDARVPPLPPLPSRRLLVVDDNPRAVAALESQLHAWGLLVTATGSAHEALTALLDAAGTEAAFDLAFIDLHMPGTDGLTLGRSVRDHDGLSELSLVLLSDDPSISPEDVLEAGFCCTVDKPVRSAELHAAIAAADTSGAGRPVAVGSVHDGGRAQEALHLSVLVVEDNPVNQLVAQGLLESLGCVSSVAANGEEAVVALAPGHAFDLVLMDCRMPRMDGYAATAQIRAQEQGDRIPIIAMTASALAGERDRCLAVGMDDFLTKPVDPATLTRVVTRWSSIDRRGGAPPSEPVTPDAAGPGVASPQPTAVPPQLSAQPVTPVEAGPVLDPDRVAMLGELVRDGVNFFERTRLSFLTRIDDLLDRLRTARDKGDLNQVSAVAHQLKGSALNLGLTRVGAAAARVESDAAAHDLTATITATESLEVAVTEAVAALADVSAENWAP